MREEYDIKNLNPRKNPYSKRIKKQVTINLDGDVIDYFKAQSESSGIPYQTLINLYLSDCVAQKESCRCPGNKEKRKKNRISNKCKRKMTKEHLPFLLSGKLKCFSSLPINDPDITAKSICYFLNI